MPEKPMEELVIAVAGPAVNVVLAIILGIIAAARGEFSTPPTEDSLMMGPLVLRLFFVNVMLVLFNMIPAFPMDGGRVLRAVLAMVTDRVQATKVAASIGQFVALGFGFYGLMSGNAILVFIALFVWIGAAQEANDVEQRSALSGVTVRTAMISEFHAVSPLDSLADVARHVLAGFQQDFPVVESGVVVGMITRRDLLTSLAAVGHEAPVAKAMQSKFEVAAPHEMLNDVLPRLQGANVHSLPVLEQNRLIGLLTSENVSELLMIRSAIAQAGRA
jgi:predicted transcriptional regulator